MRIDWSMPTVQYHASMFNREPALILALVQSALALVIAFGLELTPEQVGASLAVTAAALGVITRSRVSANA